MPTAGETYNPWRLFVGCFIPNVITRSTELSSTAKLVFGKLCQFAGENGQAYLQALCEYLVVPEWYVVASVEKGGKETEHYVSVQT